MPAVSPKQRRFAGAELGRRRRGEKTDTGMSTKQLREFASKAVSMKAKPMGKKAMPMGKKAMKHSGGKHGSRETPRDKKHSAKKMGSRKHGS